MKKVLVVGTGLGGLATALRLARQGYQVEMIDKFNRPGGRLNRIEKDGFTFDMGPSFFSMSYEFTEFARDTGIEIPFQFVELEPLYGVNFLDGNKTFYIYKDPEKMAAQFENLEPNFRGKLDRYLQSAGSFFDDTMDRIVKRNFDSLSEYLMAMATVPPKHIPKLTRTMWREVCKYFESNEVRQILSLVAFFLGGTPFDTPGVYSLLSYTELVHDGYYNVKGGMYEIVNGLVKILNQEGVKMTFNTEIVGFEQRGSRLSGLIDQHDHKHEADIYVINADAAAFRGKIFGRKAFSDKKLDEMKWTFAPFTMYLGVKGKLEGLNHHHYFLGNNFESYARKIFREKEMKERPYYYVNVISRSNPESAPAGCEGLMIVCPVSDLRYKTHWNDKNEFAGKIIDDLSARIGYDIGSNLVTQTIMTPEDWQSSFNLHRGSGLGLSHDLGQIGGFRPKNYDETFGNVFYTGASTIPGTGLPMVIISSKLVTERVNGYAKSL